MMAFFLGTANAAKISNSVEIFGRVMVSPLGCGEPNHKGPPVALFVLDEANNVLYEIDPQEGTAFLAHAGKRVRMNATIPSQGLKIKATAESTYDAGITKALVSDPKLLEVTDEPEKAKAPAQTMPWSQAAPPTTTMIKTLVVFAQFTDSIWSQSAMDGVMNVMYNNSTNVNDALQYATRGKYGVEKGKDGPGDPGFEVVTLPYAAAYKSKTSIIFEAYAAATNEAQYDRVLIFCASGTQGFTAFAYYNDPISGYSYGRRNKLETIVHELGHNFGLAHSDKDDPIEESYNEYGDKTCVMGPSPSANESAVFNAVKQDSLGIFDDYPGSLEFPTSDVTYDIYPNALDLTSNPGIRSVKYAPTAAGAAAGTVNNYVNYVKNYNPYGRLWDSADYDKVIFTRHMTSSLYGGSSWPANSARSGKVMAMSEGTSFTRDDVNVTFEVYGDSAKSYAKVSFDFDDGNAKPEIASQIIVIPFEQAEVIDLTGSDADGDSLSYDMTRSEPSHGTLFGTAPNMTYTPDAGYVGTDSFIYGVFDGTIWTYDSVSITVDGTEISVTATDPNAAEALTDAGEWTITRSGGDTSVPLEVNFNFSGTATLGDDYTVSATSSVTFPANVTSMSVTLTPVDDLVFNESTEDAILTITAGAGYAIDQAQDTINIADDDVTTYTVSYDANGASGATPPNEVFAHGTSFTLPNQGSLVRPGYTFLGWNTSPSGQGTWLNPGADFAYNTSMTLYGFWSDGSILFLENFESPVVSGYSEKTYPSETSWVKATAGFGADKVGLLNEDGGFYDDPNQISHQGLFLNYNNNSGLTTAVDEISTLASSQVYNISFDVIKSTEGRGYLVELIAFDSGASRDNVKTLPTGSTLLGSTSGLAPDDGSSSSISFTVDASNFAADVGKDLAIRLRGTGSDAVIDNIKVISGILVVSTPEVSVAATDATAAEQGTDPGTWTISRTGNTVTPLNVDVSMSGSATVTDDYTLNPVIPITIPAGQNSVVVTLTPVDDTDTEGEEVATLTIVANINYIVGAASAHIGISDDDSGDYINWISGYDVTGQTGLNDDPDKDGISNRMESLFNTDPTKWTRGVEAVGSDGNTFKFTHPENPRPPTDLVSAYLWSKDLSQYNLGGVTDVDNTQVSFTVQRDTPSVGITTVTATVTGSPVEKLFFNIRVTQE